MWSGWILFQVKRCAATEKATEQEKHMRLVTNYPVSLCQFGDHGPVLWEHLHWIASAWGATLDKMMTILSTLFCWWDQSTFSWCEKKLNFPAGHSYHLLNINGGDKVPNWHCWLRPARHSCWTLLQSNHWAVGKHHYSHFTAGQRGAQGTQTCPAHHWSQEGNLHLSSSAAQLSPLPARLLGQSYGHAHGAVTRWRMLTASGQNKSLTILHLADKREAFDWETLQVTCPTFNATLGSEKTTSDNDLEARKEIELVCAMKYKKKTKCW